LLPSLFFVAPATAVIYTLSLHDALPIWLAAEVIFLTHNDRLHEVNLGWHPKAEELLWRPDLQQPKRSQTGGRNVRYRTGRKGRYVAALTGLIAERLPFCRVRYAV